MMIGYFSSTVRRRPEYGPATLVCLLVVLLTSCGLLDEEEPAPLQLEPVPKTDECWVAYSTIQVWDDKNADARLVAQSRCNEVAELDVSRAAQVRDLRFLQGIESVKWRAVVDSNPNLVSLEGMNSVKSVGLLTVASNGALKDVRALESLRQVGPRDGSGRDGNRGVLYISSNDSLESLEGLEGLEHARTVIVAGNRRLKSIEALYGVSGVVRLDISANPNLPQCQVDRLVESLGDQLEQVTSQHNGGGACE